MPEYIQSNAGLLQSLIEARNASAANKTQSTRSIAEAVATAVNKHYESKETRIKEQLVKIAREKEAEIALGESKMKKAQQTAGILEKFQPVEPIGNINLPAANYQGTGGLLNLGGVTPPSRQPVYPSEAEITPPALQEVLGSRYMRVGKTVSPEYYNQVLSAYKDKPEILKKIVTTTQIGQDLKDFTKAVQLATKETGIPEKAPAGYRYTASGGLDAIPGGPADVKAQAALAKPTVAQTTVDKLFAKTYEDYIASGGYADLISQIDSLSDVKKSLQAGRDNLTGPVIGNLPMAARAIKYPESIKVQEQAEQTIQRTLRTTLGAQFTEKEGMLFMRRGYNPTLKESINVQKIDEMISKLKVAGEAKRDAVEYYEQNGTLTGYKGKIYRLNENGELVTVTPTVKSITGQPAPAKTAPAKPAPKDEIDKALDDMFK